MWIWCKCSETNQSSGLAVLSKRDKCACVSRPATKKSHRMLHSQQDCAPVLTSPFQTSCRHKPPLLANRWSASARSRPAEWSRGRNQPVLTEASWHWCNPTNSTQQGEWEGAREQWLLTFPHQTSISPDTLQQSYDAAVSHVMCVSKAWLSHHEISTCLKGKRW